MKIYEGSLTFNKMNKKAYQGFKAFLAMRYRSKKANLPIPEISSREFIGWWLKELKSFKGKGNPTCGRIDHSKGYSWNNFVMQSKSDNCREVALRHEKKWRLIRAKACLVIDIKTNKIIHEFDSSASAARFFKVSQRAISKMANQKIKRPGTKFTKQLKNLKITWKEL